MDADFKILGEGGGEGGGGGGGKKSNEVRGGGWTPQPSPRKIE